MTNVPLGHHSSNGVPFPLGLDPQVRSHKSSTNTFNNLKLKTSHFSIALAQTLHPHSLRLEDGKKQKEDINTEKINTNLITIYDFELSINTCLIIGFSKLKLMNYKN